MSPASFSEEQLHVAVVDYLSIHEKQGRLTFFHPANGVYLRGTASQRASQIARFKKMGMRPGVPDLVVVTPHGGTGWIELKAQKGRLTVDQEAWGERLRKLGHNHKVCRSLTDVQAMLRGMGVEA